MAGDRATRVIAKAEHIKPLLDWVYTCLSKGLPGGPIAVDVYRHEELRNLEQNRKQFAMYNDLSRQLTWHGMKLTPEQWKELLSHEWRAQAIVPGISGGFCALGVRTSKMKKREMSELIEIVYMFGSEQGVKWSEPALECYEHYREASA